ncbi:MAG TPA: hypothetical protein VGF14_01440 [Alphaproteobacteria bacterium]
MNKAASAHAPQSTRVLGAIQNLIALHQGGHLKGEIMPEDSNPGLSKSSRENAHYFTLPMTLNYQRNSYTLWESALKAYHDPETSFLFQPEKVVQTSFNDLQTALVKHKVALQKNKHTEIWQRVCETLHTHYDNNVINLFAKHDYDIGHILQDVQIDNKKSYPYLSGQKIANYWLYVMTSYTDLPFKNKQALSVAPDTHVIQATIRLGLIAAGNDHNLLRTDVAKAWADLLHGTDLVPIDIHTPLWLWSRNNFLPDPFEARS